MYTIQHKSKALQRALGDDEGGGEILPSYHINMTNQTRKSSRVSTAIASNINHHVHVRPNDGTGNIPPETKGTCWITSFEGEFCAAFTACGTVGGDE
jgi:hypothetical protein